MRYQDLMKEIKQQKFHPIYFFTGPEQYIAAMMEKHLVEVTVSPTAAMLNFMRFSEKDTAATDIITLCEQFPMMSPFRIVIAEAETGILNTKDDHEIENWIRYLKNPSPSTILIIKEPNPDKRKKLIKAFQKSAAEVEFKKLDHNELEKWIRARLKKAGKTAEKSVIEHFINRIRYLENEDQNMASVDNEISKLIDYCGNRTDIMPEDVETTLPPSVDENIYHMIDYFISGNTVEAFQMLQHFYLNGQDPIGIFALIVSQLRTILQIRILSKKRKTPQQIGSEIHRPPFVVKKLLQTSKKFQGDVLYRLMEEAAKTDWQMKTGAVEAAPAVELFLLKLLL